jgi:hypothetical protein
MGVPLAVYQAEDSVRPPLVVPEPHGDTVLAGESRGRPVVGIKGYMSVDRSGPLRRAAALDRGRGGDSHRVGALRLEGRNCRDEDGIVSDRARQACHTLFPRRKAGVPEGTKRSSGFRAEPKRGAGLGRSGLSRERDSRLGPQ